MTGGSTSRRAAGCARPRPTDALPPRSPLLRGLRLGALLVDGPGGALLGFIGADAAILVGLLDVLVLAFALRARSGGHGRNLLVAFEAIVGRSADPSRYSRGREGCDAMTADSRGTRTTAEV